MENLLRRITHLLIIMVWLGVAILLGMWALPAGLAFMLVGLYLFVRALQRGFFTLAPPVSKSADPERDAKFVVTQLLKGLTRVQVSYLSQRFKSRKESRAWLKNALPRAFHHGLDELHSKLETARMGSEVPELRLARSILERRDQLQPMEEALSAAAREMPSHKVANPMIFVVTEHLGGGQMDAEPEVITIAAWNTAEPTLLPVVDAVTLVSEEDGRTLVRGQSAFGRVREVLTDKLQPLADGKVFSIPSVEDPAALGLQVGKVPMGFVVGTAEFL